MRTVLMFLKASVRALAIATSALILAMALLVSALGVAWFVAPNVVAQAPARLMLSGGSGRAVPIPAYLLSKNIASNATTVVKSTPGVLGCIVIQKAGASSNVATVYNNTNASGTVLATIDTTATGEYCYGAIFNTALTIVTATGTAGDITVTYR